jgi:hypothetical protein
VQRFQLFFILKSLAGGRWQLLFLSSQVLFMESAGKKTTSVLPARPNLCRHYAALHPSLPRWNGDSSQDQGLKYIQNDVEKKLEQLKKDGKAIKKGREQ